MSEDVTTLLTRLTAGERDALDRLMPLVHRELHALAERLLRGQRPGHTLSATALVNELYLKLVRADDAAWRDRAHFFAVAAQAMRRILVDYARGKQREKRGGGRVRMAFDTATVLAADDDGGMNLVDFDDTLERLGSVEPRAVRVVELRYFGGLTIDEAAEVLGVSTSTVEADWRYARAWLYDALGETEAESGGPA